MLAEARTEGTTMQFRRCAIQRDAQVKFTNLTSQHHSDSVVLNPPGSVALRVTQRLRHIEQLAVQAAAHASPPAFEAF